MVSLMILTMLSMALVYSGGNNENEAPVADPADNQVSLGENLGFSWEFSGDEVIFTVIAPTTGWVSLGFNPSRGMQDASYVIGYVQDGVVHMREDYGTGRTSHASDVSLGGTDDVRSISGTEENGVTTLVFALKQNTGDQYDTVLTKGETYTVLIAYGPNGSNNFTARHTFRQSLEVQL